MLVILRIAAAASDAIEDAAFLLASPDTIHHQNDALAQGGSILRWESIEHPPVIVPASSTTTTSSSPPRLRPHASSIGDESTSRGVPNTSSQHSQMIGVISEKDEYTEPSTRLDLQESSSRAPTRTGTLSKAPSFIESFDDDISDAASIRSQHSVLRQPLGAELSANVSTDDGSHTIAVDDQSSSEVLSMDSRARRQLERMFQTVLEGGITAKEAVHAKGEPRGTSPNDFPSLMLHDESDLLIEMGTVKNVRELNEMNESFKRDSLRRHKSRLSNRFLSHINSIASS